MLSFRVFIYACTISIDVILKTNIFTENVQNVCSMCASQNIIFVRVNFQNCIKNNEIYKFSATMMKFCVCII